MKILSIVAFAVLLSGCANRLLFVEESHLGLKAKVSANSPSPYEIDIGYRRGLFALVPLRCVGDSCDIGESEELMSLFASFQGNIGFNDDIRVCHFLATGSAAVTLAANPEASGQLNIGEGCIKNSDSDEK